MNLSECGQDKAPKRRKLRQASEKQKEYLKEMKEKKQRQFNRELAKAKATLKGAKMKAAAERKVKAHTQKRLKSQRKFNEWKQKKEKQKIIDKAK